MNIPNLRAIFSNKDASYTNHFAYEPIKQRSKDGLTKSLISSEWKILPCSNLFYFFSHAFPIISIFHEPTGLGLRLINDLTKNMRVEEFFPQVKTMLSWVSFLCTFYSSGQYLKQVELFRSIVLRCEAIYKAHTDPTTDEWGWKKQQQALHLIIDLVNMGLLFSKQRLPDARLFSLALQLVATAIDFMEQKYEKSSLGMGIQVILGIMRLANFRAAAIEFQDHLNHSDLLPEEIKPVETAKIILSPTEKMVTHMKEQGTGSENLNKYEVIKHLKDENISDLFLVKNENNQTFVLKRFLSDDELIEKYPRLVHVKEHGIRLQEKAENFSRRTLEFSEKANDFNLVKVYQVITNSYKKICEKTGKEETQTDTYLLMEHFEGTPINELDPSNSHFFTYIQSIVNTLYNLSEIGYFFNFGVIEDIRVDPNTNQVKFTSLNHFYQLISESDSWKSCVEAYLQMYNFFRTLIDLSNQENKEKLVNKLNEIFSYLNLLKQLFDQKNPQREEVGNQCPKIFNTDLLRKVLKQVQDLFSVSETAE